MVGGRNIELTDDPEIKMKSHDKSYMSDFMYFKMAK
jgi:hypothetical protein